MNGIVIGSLALLVLIAVVALIIFRPRGGNVKPETGDPPLMMSADKPLVLRFPGGGPDEVGGEEPRDTLFQVGGAPSALPPDVERQQVALPPSAGAPPAPQTNSLTERSKPDAGA